VTTEPETTGSPAEAPSRGIGLSRLLDHLEEGLLVLLFAVMLVVAFVNVITRYFIRYSLAFTEEIVVSAFVWATLLGASIAFRRGANLSFTFVVDRLPRPLRRAAIWSAAGLSILLFTFLIFYGLKQIELERRLNFTTEALALPQWWYTLGLPLLSVLIIWRIVQGAAAADRGARS